jgi:signal transduction histidine kinase/CheY-like chemotaxis protein
MTIGVRQRDGSIRWAIFTAMPVALEDGRGAVVTFVDITDRRAAEKEREALGQRVAEAERLASLGTLAAGLAHEINNPLTFLLGNLELALIGDEIPRHLRQQLTDARDGGARIVRDIGAFSRQDTARVAPFDVGTALEEAIRLTGSQHRHRATLELDVDPGCTALGQEWRAVQVFVDLLSNAALACGEGSPESNRIGIAARVDGKDVVVRIEDDGCGMDADAVARAFVPFFTTRSVGAGTGLGLSISHGIVRGMGGSIELESESGVGTAVTVRLPRSEAAPAPAPPPAAPDQRAPVDTDALRILVVDDEPAIREIARAALSEHALTVVADGQAALDACDRATFDVVLLDLMMPRKTGADVLQALEETAPAQAARVVLMTGGAYTPALRSFVDQTRAPILSKPFGIAELRDAVRAAAGQGR